MSRKIRILYVTDGLGNGGKERQLIETINNINTNKFEIGVIAFNSNQHYSELANQISGYYSVFIKDKNIFEPFVTVFESFEKFKPDIVHSYDLLSSMYTYIPSKISKSKILNASIQDSGLDKGWQYKIKKYLLSASNMNISNSKKGLSYYRTQGEVLYNFINPDRFEKGKIFEDYSVAMVANFTDYKDYTSYFKIVKELLSLKLIDKSYAIGSGKYLGKYINQIRSDQLLNNSVIFTGNISNVEELLRSVSVGFLYSTEEYGEGISNSVLEYMASSVIPIVSDIGASSEIIDNEIDGFLVDKNNMANIIDIIRKIKYDDNYKDTLLLNAKRKLEDKFNLKKNIQKLEGIYQDLYNN